MTKYLPSLLLLSILWAPLTACEVDDDDEFLQTDFDNNNNNNTSDAQDDTSSPDSDMTDEDIPDVSDTPDTDQDTSDLDDTCDNTCQPPTPLCQGEVAISYQGPGIPQPDQDCRCDYTEVITVVTCNFDEGETCENGACATIPTCTDGGPLCPPIQEVCIGNNLAAFTASCMESTCTLGEISEQLTCDECIQDSEFRATCVIEPEVELEPGTCEDDNDCPPSFCDGEVANNYPSKGLCITNVCDYSGENATNDCGAISQSCVVLEEEALCQ